MIVSLFFAVYGVTVINTDIMHLNTFGVANLEWTDDVVHLVVGVWALAAAFSKAPAAGMAKK